MAIRKYRKVQRVLKARRFFRTYVGDGYMTSWCPCNGGHVLVMSEWARRNK